MITTKQAGKYIHKPKAMKGGKKMKFARAKGFTLIELVMVIVILGILSAVALPTFFNLQDDARRAAVRGSLGGLRSGVAIWYARTAASDAASYPSITQLQSSPGGPMQFGIPLNPYTNSSGILAGAAETTSTANGWIYDATTGRIWSSASQTQGSGY